MTVFNLAGMFDNMIWSFTSNDERNAAETYVKTRGLKNYIIAEDLPDYPKYEHNDITITFDDMVLRIISLSRIVPQKNTMTCFEILSGSFDGKICFDVYGTIEDEKYWSACKHKALSLPNNVKFRYMGEVSHEEVMDTFHKYDAFLFPTRGENFGHVIYEALSAGCIPIISDTTPWSNVYENGAGFVISYADIAGYRNAINSLILLKQNNKEAFLHAKTRALEYAVEKFNNSLEKTGYDIVFLT
jgi:glycosyltransferase involved in cell wall biosynthesis